MNKARVACVPIDSAEAMDKVTIALESKDYPCGCVLLRVTHHDGVFFVEFKNDPISLPAQMIINNIHEWLMKIGAIKTFKLY